MLSRLFIAFIIGSCAFSLQTRADFVNNIESFPGTSLDLQTWHVAPTNYASYYPSAITQNNGLVMDATNTTIHSITYSTNSALVTSGVGVRVGFILHQFTADSSIGPPALFDLYLASTLVDYPWTAPHSLAMTADENSTNTGTFILAFSDNAGAGALSTSQLQLEHLYYFQIFRTSTSAASMAFLDSGGQNIASTNMTNAFLPASMYISLHAQAADITCTTVTLLSSPGQPVPEPGSLAILGLASAALITRRRRWI